MKTNGIDKIVVLCFTLLLLGCGNRSEIANGPTVIEEEEEQPSVSITTTTGATPEFADRVDPTTTETVEGDATSIQWMDFETAIDRNKEEKKFIFIDMYTSWCGWCKKMDASTFQDPSVINYIDQNFYAVKLNPESKEAIAYKEVLYESKLYGKKMYNELAVNLMAGKMSFPSFVVLNKREVKKGVIAGYQTSSQLIRLLKQYVE